MDFFRGQAGDVARRAVYTAAQVFVALVAAEGVSNVDVSEVETFGLTALAAGLSVITSAVRATADSRNGVTDGPQAR
jgi:hypothetical protein